MAELLVEKQQPSSPHPQSERTLYKDTWGKVLMSNSVTVRKWRIVTVILPPESYPAIHSTDNFLATFM